MTPADLMDLGPVLPVVVLRDDADAVPLARALLDGGVRTMELTLRTPVALDAIKRVAAEVPDMVIGAGTITEPAQAADAVRAGTRFLVSPGSPSALITAMLDEGVPVLPGVSTVTEAMELGAFGLTEMKFFPAAASGGPAYLKAMADPLPGLSFCPTGGVRQENLASYLALPNVRCVGGTWLAPDALVRAGNWQAITGLAVAAAGSL
ncbi:MAG TPA: bifunctional 4-hydroxy-2-oxoglutarate aldolase/2-dehydro-3-deoxy-phosphogluconate aldolase [Trebonia sp.]|jgi:2-dehydro-3-deoxyphosphogluconate aldolase/(4S)-4-hydroxy-2-oxoglutarate aldolase